MQNKQFNALAVAANFEKSLRALREIDSWKSWLRFSGKFTTGTAENRASVYFAKPDAVLVRSRVEWQRLGRDISESAVDIPLVSLVDVPKNALQRVGLEGAVSRTADGGLVIDKDARSVNAYTVKTVYDLSDTTGSGQPVLQAGLSGIAEYSDFYLGELENIVGEGAFSFARLDDGRNLKVLSGTDFPICVINSEATQEQMLMAAITSVAFYKLQALKGEGQGVLNIGAEAESIAYRLCSNLGIDTASLSFKSWDKLCEAASDVDFKTMLSRTTSVGDVIYHELKERSFYVSSDVCKYPALARTYIEHATENFGAEHKEWGAEELARFRVVNVKSFRNFDSPVAIEIISGNNELFNGQVLSLADMQAVWSDYNARAAARITAAGKDSNRVTERVTACAYYQTSDKHAKFMDFALEFGDTSRSRFETFYEAFACELAEYDVDAKYFPEVAQALADEGEEIVSDEEADEAVEVVAEYDGLSK